MYVYMWPNFREHYDSPVDGLRLSPTFVETTRSDHVAFVASPCKGADRIQSIVRWERSGDFW